MKVILEVFYMRIMGDQVHYRRRQVDLGKKGTDPDALVQSLTRNQLHSSRSRASKEFVVHSTSWRYASPRKIVLTYIAYSDELAFPSAAMKSLTLKQLRKINISSGQPRSRVGRERQVVAHAMRHISFLIKTDYRGEFKHAFTPRTRKIFRSLWISLAGRLTF
jgi:hypothetical protein